jgi:hypothetical protein
MRQVGRNQLRYRLPETRLNDADNCVAHRVAVGRFRRTHGFLVVPTGILSDVLLSELPKSLHYG